MAYAMQNAHGVNLARNRFYEKNKGKKLSNLEPVTDFGPSFGLKGLVRAGLDPVEQFIGNYRVDMDVEDGLLTYYLSNNSSFTSFSYGVGPSWDTGPMGNYYQMYIFQEPIDFNRLK